MPQFTLPRLRLKPGPSAIAAVMKTTPPAAIAGPSLLLLLLFAAAPLLARRDRVGAAVVSRGC